MTNSLKSFLPSLLALVFAGATHGQMILVPNNDFSTNPGHPGVADGSDTQAILDVTESNSGGGVHYGNAGVPAPDGSTSGFVNTDGAGTVTLTNDLTAGGSRASTNFIAGDTYTFSLEIGVNPTNSNQGYDHAGDVTFGLLANGAAVGTFTSFTSAQNAPNVINGAPQITFYTQSYSYTATAQDAGKAISLDIVTSYGGPSQTEFSNATLTAPEPSTYAMLGLGLVGLGFFARRKLA